MTVVMQKIKETNKQSIIEHKDQETRLSLNIQFLDNIRLERTFWDIKSSSLVS